MAADKLVSAFKDVFVETKQLSGALPERVVSEEFANKEQRYGFSSEA